MTLFHALFLCFILSRSLTRFLLRFKIQTSSFSFSSLHFPQPNPMGEEDRFILGEKRNPSFDDSSSENPQRRHDFRLSKCRKLDGGNGVVSREPGSNTSVVEKFRARLEIYSPDSFSVTPVQLQGFRFPEKQDCLRQLNEILYEVGRI